ncbi:uncharacterized protein LOC111272178 [Varroa jacobsoni]|nr:uncharacterized protein LOC111251620 isoform X2 [Varroa destructor]XP_022664092.1 uncharacterized protein LOC111251620 isoform X2 [Varroa destructor]XP_022664093.1 uncharacterized protein LOC111251620 isoform X2 [Varroa destructor]XP_022709201.1 uncharacterized protein LOC111272178 [Varroa jacobsoni]
MERPLLSFEGLIFLLLLLLYQIKPIHSDPAASESGGSGNSMVAQLLAGKSGIEESALREFDEEAYDVCRRYIALHDTERRTGVHLPLQGGNFRESVGGGSLNTARDGIVGDEEDGEATSTGIALSREIRRPPSRARVYAYRGQGEEGDYGVSTEYTKVVSSKKRSCIRRGGSCDARPGDCCYHSSCRCNLWGTNCRCMRMGLLQRWINGRRR